MNTQKQVILAFCRANHGKPCVFGERGKQFSKRWLKISCQKSKQYNSWVMLVCVRRIAFNQQTVLISTSDQYILIRIRTMMKYKIVTPASDGYSQKIEEGCAALFPKPSPSLWPTSAIFLSSLFMTWKSLTSSKSEIPSSWLQCKNHTLYMMKTAGNPSLWSRKNLYRPYKKVPHPPPITLWEKNFNRESRLFVFFNNI